MTILNRRGLLRGFLLLPFVPGLRPKPPEVVEALEFCGGFRIERFEGNCVRFISRGLSAVSIFHDEHTNVTSVGFSLDDPSHEARIGWGECEYGDLAGLASDPKAFVHVQWSLDREATGTKKPFWVEVKP